LKKDVNNYNLFVMLKKLLPVLTALAAFLFSVPGVKAQDYWQSLELSGAEIFSSAVSETNGNIYAANLTYVFVSANNGESWNNISSEDFFSSILSIASAPNGYLYAGLQGGGIWWTSNGGGSWDFHRLSVGQQGQWSSVTCIGVSQANTVFANTALTGNFRSTNNGQSWTQYTIPGLSPFDGVTDYAYSAGAIYIATTVGIYKSTDDGLSWVSISSSLGNINFNTVTRDNSGNLYAGGASAGIYFSPNEGQTWEQRNTGLGNLRINSIKVSGSEVYAGTNGSGVFKSVNNGALWSAAGQELEPMVNTLAVSGGKVLAGTLSGMYSTVNGGAAWSSSNTGISLNNINSVISKPGGKLFVGSRPGVFFSSNGGNTWAKRNTNIDVNYYVSSMKKDGAGNIYAAANKLEGFVTASKLYRSTNDAADWSEISIPSTTDRIFDIAAGGPVLTAVAEPTNTSFTLYVTDDGGARWHERFSHDMALFESIEVNGSGDIYVHYRDLGGIDSVVYSTNRGGTWNILPNAVSFQPKIRLFKINQSDNSIYTIRGNDLRFTTDNGQSWQTASTPFDANEIVPVSMDFNSAGHIFAGTVKKGIYRTTNSGASWEAVNSGLPPHYNGPEVVYSRVFALSFDEQNYLYAGTSDDGIFRSTQSTTGITQTGSTVPDKFMLGQNYPNPFNPVTNLEFSITGFGFVSLKVYNIRGQEIETLVHGNLKPGSYNITFNGSGLESGIYFYRLSAGDFSETRKMILVK
jgi:photosystem II stability/assembly factor-like uncharacterized protein